MKTFFLFAILSFNLSAAVSIQTENNEVFGPGEIIKVTIVADESEFVNELGYSSVITAGQEDIAFLYGLSPWLKEDNGWFKTQAELVFTNKFSPEKTSEIGVNKTIFQVSFKGFKFDSNKTSQGELDYLDINLAAKSEMLYWLIPLVIAFVGVFLFVSKRVWKRKKIKQKKREILAPFLNEKNDLLTLFVQHKKLLMDHFESSCDSITVVEKKLGDIPYKKEVSDEEKKIAEVELQKMISEIRGSYGI